MSPDKLDGKLSSATVSISSLKLPFCIANLYYFCQYLMCIHCILLKIRTVIFWKWKIIGKLWKFPSFENKSYRKISKRLEMSILGKENYIGKIWNFREFPSVEKEISSENFKIVPLMLFSAAKWIGACSEDAVYEGWDNNTREQGGGIHGGALRAEHGTISGWCSVVYIWKY